MCVPIFFIIRKKERLQHLRLLALHNIIYYEYYKVPNIFTANLPV